MFKRPPTSTTPATTATNAPAKGLRPGLRWALGLSAVASAWAMLAPADPPVVAATAPAPGQGGPNSPAPRPPMPTTAPTTVPTTVPMNARTAAPGQALALAAVPARLPEQPLEPADRDPFAIPQPPPPQAPALNYRYLGQFIDPQGQRKVYLARPDKDLLVEAGTRLDEGYRVEAITDDEIRLVYEPLQQRTVIRIPAASPSP